MEIRLRAPVTRGYFFLLASALCASLRNIDQKKISSGTHGKLFGNFNPNPKKINPEEGPEVVQKGFKWGSSGESKLGVSTFYTDSLNPLTATWLVLTAAWLVA